MQMELTKIKMEMLCNTDFTFFTNLLFSLDIVEDDSIPTACTDGRSIRVSPKFWGSVINAKGFLFVGIKFKFFV